MAFPTIQYNNSTGSDTQASGAGPATAVFGTAAATHTNTTVNITDGGVDLSGVATDASAALWIASSSGRRWAAISAVSGSIGNWTVTTTQAYANTESGKSWAIGGKRASLDNADAERLMGESTADTAAGWTVDIQYTGTPYAYASTHNGGGTCASVTGVNGTNANPVTITSSNAAGNNRPLITTALNNVNLWNVSGSPGNLIIRNLAFSTTGAVASNGRGVYPAGGVTGNSAGNVLIENCVFDGFAVAIDGDDTTWWAFSDLVTALSEGS